MEAEEARGAEGAEAGTMGMKPNTTGIGARAGTTTGNVDDGMEAEGAEGARAAVVAEEAEGAEGARAAVGAERAEGAEIVVAGKMGVTRGVGMGLMRGAMAIENDSGVIS